MEEEPVCLRCGKCCYLVLDNKHTKKKCKHLIILNNGKTLCRAYKDRLGKDLGKGNRCTMRENTPYIIPGCPFNDLIRKKFGDKVIVDNFPLLEKGTKKDED